MSAEAGLGGGNLLRTIDDSEEIGRLSTNPPGILGLAVSPDGMLLACATSAFNLWDATSGETGPVPPARAPLTYGRSQICSLRVCFTSDPSRVILEPAKG